MHKNETFIRNPDKFLNIFSLSYIFGDFLYFILHFTWITIGVATHILQNTLNDNQIIGNDFDLFRKACELN